MSNVITVGSSGKPSAAAQWKSSNTQRITTSTASVAGANEEAAGSSGTKIPLSKIKVNSNAGQAAMTPGG